MTKQSHVVPTLEAKKEAYKSIANPRHGYIAVRPVKDVTTIKKGHLVRLKLATTRVPEPEYKVLPKLDEEAVYTLSAQYLVPIKMIEVPHETRSKYAYVTETSEGKGGWSDSFSLLFMDDKGNPETESSWHDIEYVEYVDEGIYPEVKAMFDALDGPF